jgi:NTE family protein
LKKAGVAKDKDITFEDMHIAGCPPLKIIATNTATESLELFCLERTPHVVVADAVAASICLPIIFKPKTLKFIRHTPFAEREVRGIFLDGGLVSNLPAWALDEERLLHPGVPTIALSLSPPAPMNRKFWFNALTGTIVNGSSEIHTRTPNQILTVSLETKTDLLDFDLPATKVFKEVEEAQKRVTQELSMALRGPIAMQAAVKELHRELQRQLQRYKGILFLPQADDRLRVAIAVQRGNSMKTVSVVFAHGYAPGDLDADMTILIEGSHAGEAWKRSEVIVDEVDNGVAARFDLHARSWSAMTWLLCCPVPYAAEKGRKARPFIITVDSNIKFNRNAVHFEKTLKRFQAFISYTVERYTTDTNLAQYAQGANTWL